MYFFNLLPLGSLFNFFNVAPTKFFFLMCFAVNNPGFLKFKTVAIVPTQVPTCV